MSEGKHKNTKKRRQGKALKVRLGLGKRLNLDHPPRKSVR